MELSGYLYKWTNYVNGWQSRFFSLQNSILHYNDPDTNKIKGQIHLNVSEILLNQHDNLGIIIDSGTKILHLKASNLTEKLKWFNALRIAKKESNEMEQSVKEMKNYAIKPEFLQHFWRQKQDGQDLEKDIEGKIQSIKGKEKIIDKILENLSKKFNKSHDRDIIEIIDQLVETTADLLKEVDNCVNYFEFMGRKLQNIVIKKEDFEILSPDIEESIKLAPIDEEQKDKETFSCLINNKFQNCEYKEYCEFLNVLKLKNLEKYKFLSENKIFKTILITNQSNRVNLPDTQIQPKERIDSSIIKEWIGKTFENLTIPIRYYEPLSLLQRIYDSMQHYNLIELADKSLNIPSIVYISSFIFSTYESITERIKKPFNSVIGETFSYISNDNLTKFFSEQVTSEISVFQLENKFFCLLSNLNIKIKHKGKNLEFLFEGNTTIFLKNKKEVFNVKNKFGLSLENLVVGDIYLELIDKIEIINETNHNFLIINSNKRNWNEKQYKELLGQIKNDRNEIIGEIKAKINEYFIYYDIEGKEEQIIFEENRQRSKTEEIKSEKKYENERKNTIIEFTDKNKLIDIENNYFFNKFTLQLNYINQNMIFKLPLSDSRFRSDIRALEWGLFEMSEKEKYRIEIQASKRKSESFIPQWFELINDKWISKENYWIFYENTNFNNDVFY